MPSIWRVSAAETLASMFAVAAGASIALLALDLEYNTGNVIAVINPLEKMLTFADASTADAANASGLWGILLLLLERDRIGAGALYVRAASLAASDGISRLADRPRHRLCVAARRKAGRDPGPDAAAGRDRNRRAGVRRGLKSEYFIFTDPLIILAGAVLLDALSDLRFHKWTYPIAMALFVLHIAVGQAEPVKYAFKQSGPESICEWSRHYLPLLPLPWCPAVPP